MQTPEERADDIAQRIMRDLDGRRGLTRELDSDIKEEIRAAHVGIVLAAIRAEREPSADAYELAARIADREADRCTEMMAKEWHEGVKTDEEMASRRAWVVRRGGAKEIALTIRAVLDPDAPDEIKAAVAAARAGGR